MNSEEIKQLVSRSHVLSDTFKGVFPRSSFLAAFPESIPRGSYIVNSSDGLPGIHWLALYVHGDDVRVLFFFDSLGMSPSYYGMEFPHYTVLHNTQKFQSPGTPTCALFALYFIYFKCLGFTLRQILDTFDCEDKFANENTVRDFCVALLTGKL